MVFCGKKSKQTKIQGSAEKTYTSLKFQLTVNESRKLREIVRKRRKVPL